MNRHRDVLLLIAFFTAIRIWVAPTFGLGVDEAHYILYAVNLDLSYVDHPPLVGWFHAPFYYLFGTSEFLVRLPAILLFAIASFLAYLFTMQISGSRKIALLAVVALNSSFLLNAMSLMLLPDAFLLVLIIPLISTILKIEDTGKLRYYVALGLILGLCGLAKYTSVVLVPSIFVYFVFRKRFDLIFSAWTIVSVVIALLLIWPVLYWNLQNDFASFRYQWSHVMGPSTLKILSFLSSLGAQAGAYSPFLFGIALYGFYKGFRSEDRRIWLSILLGGTVLAFHLYVSLYDLSLPHWGSVFYFLFIPIGVTYLSIDGSAAKRKILHFSVGVSLVITLLLYAELAAKWFTFPDYNSPFRDIYGFDTIAREADTLLKDNKNPRSALAVIDWTMGSRMMYYSLPYNHKVFITEHRGDQFDFWAKGEPLGYDLLFVDANPHREERNFVKRFRCDDIHPARELEVTLNGAKVNRIEFVWCKNYQGEKRGDN
jgi:4-amino-4-deoxy-L-arabinose transferase-like glycosyltransferase